MASAPVALRDAPTAVTAGGPNQEEVRPGVRFGPADDIYEVGEEVGSGAAARVYTCQRLRTGEQLAVKVINLQRLRLMGDIEGQLVKLNREVQILQGLRHEKIVNLCTVHKTENFCFLVMELVCGGELFYQIVQNRSFAELESRYVFRQLLEGIGYMHSMHVIHRDLKPENILIVRTLPAVAPLSGNLHDVKIADFGLSKIISEGTSMGRTFVGTPQYWAPEVLNVQSGGGSYDQAADFWSLGAVLFVMLSGRYPFTGKNQPLEEQIRTASYNMSTQRWQGISEEAKDMVRGLLKVDPRERLNLEDCLKHPWVLGHAKVQLMPLIPAPKVDGPLAIEPGFGPALMDVTGATSHNIPLVTGPIVASGVELPRVESAKSADLRKDSAESVPAAGSNQTSHKPGHERKNIPSITVAGEPVDMDTEQERIFCLHELLKLQVSIAGSLEMACLAFRHADKELAEAIRATFRQARDLSQRAANIVGRYAQVAQQVSQLVLPDLSLAVQEKEPALAMNLLSMVKDWVVEMKAEGEDMQRRYAQLSQGVHVLTRRAASTKAASDVKLTEAIQAVEPPPTANPAAPSPRSQQMLAIGGSGEYASSEDEGHMTDAVPSNPAVSLGPGMSAAAVGAGPAGGQKSETAVQPVGGGLSAPAHSLNNLTQQLFEQLSQLASSRQKSSDVPMLSAGNMDSAPIAREVPGDAAMELQAEAWKRDVLDLLFMAPGIGANTLPKLEGFKVEANKVATDLGEMQVDEGDEVRRVSEGYPSATASSVSAPEIQVGEPQDAIVCYVQPENAKTAAQAATHMSAALLRALRELKRVDEILQGCSAFWQNMDGTVQKLAQMKEHTECLVNFASNSARLRERFEQRLGEYTSFWASLERLCRQYVVDHQNASKRMYEFLREVGDAADLMDTTESARMGMLFASSHVALAHPR